MVCREGIRTIGECIHCTLYCVRQLYIQSVESQDSRRVFGSLWCPGSVVTGP